MREDPRHALLGLSDHRSEAFRQKMMRYFQYNSGSNGSKPWNGIKSIPHENAEQLPRKALEL